MATALKSPQAKEEHISRLTFVKIIHTIIWLFFNFVIGYLFYAGITNTIGLWTWLSIGAVIAEGVVLLIFNNKCPLTVIARNYSSSTKDNFDIYLPNWLAKYNKLIYTALFLIAVFIILYRVS